MTDDLRGLETSALGEYEVAAAGEAPSPVAMVRRLLRGRMHWALALGSVLAAAGGVAGYRSTKPLFTSSGLIEVTPKPQKILFETEDNAIPPMFDAFVDSQAALARNRRVVDKAMATETWRSVGRGITDAEVGKFSNRMGVRREQRTPFISLMFTDESPAVAQKGAQALMEAFLAVVEDRQLTGGTKRLDQLDEMRDELNAKLDDVGRRELLVSGGYGSQAIQSQYAAQTDELNRLNSVVNQLDVDIGKLGSEDGAAPTDDKTEMSVQQMALQHGGVAAALTQKAGFERQVQRLIDEQQLGENHPDLKAARQDLADADRRLAELVHAVREDWARQGGAPTGDDVQLAQLRKQREQVQEMRQRCVTTLKELASNLDVLQKLDQERQVLLGRLDTVKFRLEQLTVEADSALGRITKVADPEWPVGPSSDSRVSRAAAGFLGGMGLGFALLVLYGLLRGEMRHVEDVVAHESSGRFLAIVPEVGIESDEDAPDAAEMSDYAIHHIRTLLQIRSSRPHRIVALTSPAADAGKTTVGLALGLSFGAAGSRTLLVDCDLVGHGLTAAIPSLICDAASSALAEFGRQPQDLRPAARAHLQRVLAGRARHVTDESIEEILTRVREIPDSGDSELRGIVGALEAVARYRGVNGFAAHARRGVLDVVRGAALDDCVLQTGFANLTVLPIGDARQEDATKLGPEHLERLARACRERYDTILLDTGPILASLEASFVAAIADEILFVVSRGQPRRDVDEALRQLERIGADVSGIVFNRASITDAARSSYSSRSASVPAGNA